MRSSSFLLFCCSAHPPCMRMKAAVYTRAPLGPRFFGRAGLRSPPPACMWPFAHPVSRGVVGCSHRPPAAAFSFIAGILLGGVPTSLAAAAPASWVGVPATPPAMYCCRLSRSSTVTMVGGQHPRGIRAVWRAAAACLVAADGFKASPEMFSLAAVHAPHSKQSAPGIGKDRARGPAVFGPYLGGCCTGEWGGPAGTLLHR
jgi:hypothetical protein